jgi:hypothetical protein
LRLPEGPFRAALARNRSPGGAGATPRDRFKRGRADRLAVEQGKVVAIERDRSGPE